MLASERIFSNKDLPYTTQIIPLAVLCTILDEDHSMHSSNVSRLMQWYWCGVFGEMYGGANETRYVQDVVGFMNWIKGEGEQPRTITEAYFTPTRLLSLQSRQSAAYKGIMALILKNHACDFISGEEMDFVNYTGQYVDIHHIFPRDYCEQKGYPKSKWNSAINKTPITYRTNREIGGVAPSQYLTKIENKGKVSAVQLNNYVSTHLINPDNLRTDNFNAHIIYRAKMILELIEAAMGKSISGKDSEETIRSFGESLL